MGNVEIREAGWANYIRRLSSISGSTRTIRSERTAKSRYRRFKNRSIFLIREVLFAIVPKQGVRSP